MDHTFISIIRNGSNTDFKVGDNYRGGVGYGRIVKIERVGNDLELYIKSEGFESGACAYYDSKRSGDYTGD